MCGEKINYVLHKYNKAKESAEIPKVEVDPIGRTFYTPIPVGRWKPVSKLLTVQVGT